MTMIIIIVRVATATHPPTAALIRTGRLLPVKDKNRREHVYTVWCDYRRKVVTGSLCDKMDRHSCNSR